MASRAHIAQQQQQAEHARVAELAALKTELSRLSKKIDTLTERGDDAAPAKPAPKPAPTADKGK